MEAKRLTYRVSVILSGLNLAAVIIAIVARSRLFAIVHDLAPADRARFDAVTIIEFFLLVVILAAAASLTLYMKREARA